MNSYLDPIAVFLGEWSSGLNPYSILFRYGVAFVCAAIIGCERAHKRHSAGLRTFILVAIGSVSAMLLEIYCGLQGFGHILLPAACLIGIAMISANSFLYSSKNQIKGLTTAVALWQTAFVGLAFGGGFYTAGVISYTAFFLCLSVLPPMEKWLVDRSNHFEVHLELKSVGYLKDFIATARQIGLRIDDIELNPAYVHSGLSVYSVSFTIAREELKKYKEHSEIIEALGTLEYVSHIEGMI